MRPANQLIWLGGVTGKRQRRDRHPVVDQRLGLLERGIAVDLLAVDFALCIARAVSVNSSPTQREFFEYFGLHRRESASGLPTPFFGTRGAIGALSMFADWQNGHSTSPPALLLVKSALDRNQASNVSPPSRH